MDGDYFSLLLVRKKIQCKKFVNTNNDSYLTLLTLIEYPSSEDMLSASFALPAIYTAMVAVLGAALVIYAIQTLQPAMNVIHEKLRNIDIKPRYKSSTEVHHIIAQTAVGALPSRRILSNIGLNVEIEENKVSLKTGFHRRLHTTSYYTAVNSIMGKVYKPSLSKAKNQQRIKASLNVIKAFLKGQNVFARF
ncbi:AHH domain-containing protein [Bacillus salitolerans]|uniref:AHH domain-containing protein n=1 Tax=Bacillus salitolerans TaxID=1437434 RepID=A0ABW4LR17_9BACI